MWDLPFFVEINGKKHPIRNKCDYRVILDVICAPFSIFTSLPTYAKNFLAVRSRILRAAFPPLSKEQGLLAAILKYNHMLILRETF